MDACSGWTSHEKVRERERLAKHINNVFISSKKVWVLQSLQMLYHCIYSCFYLKIHTLGFLLFRMWNKYGQRGHL